MHGLPRGRDRPCNGHARLRPVGKAPLAPASCSNPSYALLSSRMLLAAARARVRKLPHTAFSGTVTVTAHPVQGPPRHLDPAVSFDVVASALGEPPKAWNCAVWCHTAQFHRPGTPMRDPRDHAARSPKRRQRGGSEGREPHANACRRAVLSSILARWERTDRGADRAGTRAGVGNWRPPCTNSSKKTCLTSSFFFLAILSVEGRRVRTRPRHQTDSGGSIVASGRLACCSPSVF